MTKEKIWINGKVKNQEEDKIYCLSAFHYGTVAFDGILCIQDKKRKNNCFLFRLSDHLNRIFYSAKVLGLKIPYSKDEFANAIIDLVKSNGYASYYIRPLVFSNNFYTNILPKSKEEFVNVVILHKKFNFWKFSIRMKRGLKLIISKKIRNTWIEELTLAKISGKYLNYFLTLHEAKNKGFDEAIILDDEEKVSEASTSNIFIVKGNAIKTPPPKNILPGITRATVIEIAKNMNYDVKEERFSIEELFNADEIFLTNTARGIVSVFQVGDSNKFNKSEVASLIRDRYISIIRGEDSTFSHWSTPISI